MIKLRYLILLLAISIVLCACGNTGTAAESSEPTSEPTEATVESTEAPTEPTETEPPVTDVAREMIRNGEYQPALELLESESSEEAAFLRLRAGLGDPAVGDQIILGSYEQDGDSENGAEEIQWIVLARDGDKALLLSLYCLDTRPYHDVMDGAVTWAESPLRTWLNSEFRDAAFSGTEQQLLSETELVNSDSATYGTPGGENTVDRVFLLSLDEAKLYLNEETKLGAVSQYAISKGCYVNWGGNGWWWLRSPGIYSRDAAYVSAVGEISVYGYVVHRPGWAIRPAIWIDLSV